MLSRREIERAIRECEEGNSSYQNCEKLATLYTIYEHLYSVAEPKTITKEEEVVGEHGSGEFMVAIQGMRSDKAWRIVGELMEALQVTNPRLYESVLRKVAT